MIFSSNISIQSNHFAAATQPDGFCAASPQQTHAGILQDFPPLQVRTQPRLQRPAIRCRYHCRRLEGWCLLVEWKVYFG